MIRQSEQKTLVSYTKLPVIVKSTSEKESLERLCRLYSETGLRAISATPYQTVYSVGEIPEIRITMSNFTSEKKLDFYLILRDPLGKLTELSNSSPNTSIFKAELKEANLKGVPLFYDNGLEIRFPIGVQLSQGNYYLYVLATESNSQAIYAAAETSFQVR